MVPCFACQLYQQIDRSRKKAASHLIIYIDIKVISVDLQIAKITEFANGKD